MPNVDSLIPVLLDGWAILGAPNLGLVLAGALLGLIALMLVAAAVKDAALWGWSRLRRSEPMPAPIEFSPVRSMRFEQAHAA